MTNMSQPNITFIGGGNMARALIAGLMQTDYPADNIWVTNPSLEKLETLRSHFGVHITQDNLNGAEQADVIVLAVKPNVLATVAQELAPLLDAKPRLIISVASGITPQQLQRHFNQPQAIVWAMPNTPAAVGAGATGLHANEQATAAQRDMAESIFQSVGLTVWIEQAAQMNVVTAIASGPAYIFLVIESLQDAAQALGLDATAAKLLVTQMVFGAAKMSLELEQDVVQLREAVTSPQGTTAAALQQLEAGHLRELLAQAMQAACQRGQELSNLHD